MCHADVGTIPFSWELEPAPGFAANFPIVKLCKDFDGIHEFEMEHKPMLKPPSSETFGHIHG